MAGYAASQKARAPADGSAVTYSASVNTATPSGASSPRQAVSAASNPMR